MTWEGWVITERIAVIGGGYGGLAFIRRLVALRPDAVTTLIDRNPYHTALTEIHEVAAGNRAPATIRIPFAELEGFRFIQAEVTGLDAAGRRVLTSAGPVEYDLLVLALGGTDTDFGVPGVAEHTRMLHSLQDALAIRDRLDLLPERASILIAGGGLTGVELAAEIGMRRGTTGNITLVEAAPMLLPGLAGVLQRGARRRLGSLGVNVLTGSRIARVDEGMVHFQDGSALPFALMVWACGVRSNLLVARLGLPVDKAGRTIVDGCLRTALPGVYALGDCAATGLPPTAQAACQQGAHLADHVVGLLQGEERPVAPVRMRGTLVALGHIFGVGSLGDSLHMAGWLPALLKHLNVAKWFWTAAGLHGVRRYCHGSGAPVSGRMPSAGTGSPE
jgi:NADH:ubiquinone reductase (H+-translocating)